MKLKQLTQKTKKGYLMNYIKIKLFTIVILNLFIIPVYGDEAALSKEETLKQIALKEEQLNSLSKIIVDVEVSMNSIIDNIHNVAARARDRKKQELLKEKLWFLISETDIKNAYLTEAGKFFDVFNDADHKNEMQIVGGSFFKECLVPVWASVLKFHLVRFILARKRLEVLLIEWENLSKEIFDLYIQVGATRL